MDSTDTQHKPLKTLIPYQYTPVQYQDRDQSTMEHLRKPGELHPPGLLNIIWKPVMWVLEKIVTKYFELVSRTWDVHFHGLEHVRSANKAGGIYLGMWHRSILLLAPTHARRGIYAIVSPVWQGEPIARLLQGFGYNLVRGSEITGRVQGFKESVRLLKNGNCLTAAMDGPTGPLEKVKGGIVTMAGAAGASILPIDAVARHYQTLPTWDNQILPLPFTTVHVAYAPAVSPPKRPRGEEIEKQCEEIEFRMKELKNFLSEQINSEKS